MRQRGAQTRGLIRRVVAGSVLPDDGRLADGRCAGAEKGMPSVACADMVADAATYPCDLLVGPRQWIWHDAKPLGAGSTGKCPEGCRPKTFLRIRAEPPRRTPKYSGAVASQPTRKRRCARRTHRGQQDPDRWGCCGKRVRNVC